MTDHFDGTDAFLERNGWKYVGSAHWRHQEHGTRLKNDAIGLANRDAKPTTPVKPYVVVVKSDPMAPQPGTYAWCRAQMHEKQRNEGGEWHCHNEQCTYAACDCPAPKPVKTAMTMPPYQHQGSYGEHVERRIRDEVACTVCKSAAGDWCIDLMNGEQMTAIHTDRMMAWEKQA